MALLDTLTRAARTAFSAPKTEEPVQPQPTTNQWQGSLEGGGTFSTTPTTPSVQLSPPVNPAYQIPSDFQVQPPGTVTPAPTTQPAGTELLKMYSLNYAQSSIVFRVVLKSTRLFGTRRRCAMPRKTQWSAR